MKYIQTVIAYFIVSFICAAQITQPEHISKNAIEVIGKTYLDSVIIRWAPSTVDLWLHGNKQGYKIIRKTVGFGDSIFNDNPIIKELTPLPLKPMSIEEIRPIAEKDFYAGIVAQAIYGESFQVTTQSPENLINKAKEIDNRYSFSLFSCDMSRSAALSHGLMYIDKDIHKNGHYIYQVFLASEDLEMKYDTGLLYIQVSDTSSLPKPIDLKAFKGDKNITLTWNKKLLDDIYTAYIIERSDDGKTFIQRNNNPLVNVYENSENVPDVNIFVDSIPENQIQYTYRIKGISPLGETGPSSDTVKVSGEVAMYMLNPMITSSGILTGGSVIIRWEIPYADSIHAREFIISRAENSSNKFDQISKAKISGLERTFIDSKPFGVNYYIVEAIDELGRRYRSFPSLVMLEDSVPPCVPKGLTGFCDSLGVIHLKWDHCIEKDLAGYKVFRYNNPNAEPVKLNDTAIISNIFSDTLSLKTLTNYFYYSVASFDNHYNQSDFSSVLKVRLYDTIAPHQVNFIGYESVNRSVCLHWNKSFSTDAEEYRIYRRKSEKEKWELIAKCHKDSILYCDPNLSGSYFEYVITCLDDKGNESEYSQVLGVKPIPSEKMEQLEIKVKNNQNNSCMILFKSARTDIKRIQIYRSMNNEPFTLYSSIEYTSDEVTDRNLKIGNLYTYRIQLIFSDGSRSKLSDSVSINMD